MLSGSCTCLSVLFCSRPTLVVRENIHGAPTFSICQYLDAQFPASWNPFFGVRLVKFGTITRFVAWTIEDAFAEQTGGLTADFCLRPVYSVYIGICSCTCICLCICMYKYSFTIPLTFHLCSIYIPCMFKFSFHSHYSIYILFVQWLVRILFFCCKALVSFGGFCHGDACFH